MDKKAIIFKVQYLSGKDRRRSGGYKRESSRDYPGRSASRRKAGSVRPCDLAAANISPIGNRGRVRGFIDVRHKIKRILLNYFWVRVYYLSAVFAREKFRGQSLVCIAGLAALKREKVGKPRAQRIPCKNIVTKGVWGFMAFLPKK